VAGEDRRLAIANLVADQLSGLSDDVKLIVVDFELGRAKRVHRVIDCQRMQVIRSLERVKFVGGGLAKRNPAEARARSYPARQRSSIAISRIRLPSL
jgi:hypothetical protein